jgi:transcriptional regulator with XRE-family HTH domain
VKNLVLLKVTKFGCKRMLSKAIGSRIQVLRMRKKLTQLELAKLANIHRSYLAAVETGDRNISLESLEKIIHALNMDYNSFFQDLNTYVSSN